MGSRAYIECLKKLLSKNNGHTVRGLSIHSEIVGAFICINDARSLDINPPGRKWNKSVRYSESLWDLCSDNESWILQAFNKNIGLYLDTEGPVSWGYGPHIKIQLPKCVEELKKDIYSRRAVIAMPRDIDTKGTPPCLVAIQFLARPNRSTGQMHLDAVVTMRSNDIWLGFPLDIFQFGLMQHVVAGALGLKIGSYYHYVGSLHLYEKDVIAAEKQMDEIENLPYNEFGITSGWETEMQQFDEHVLRDLEYLHQDLKQVALEHDYAPNDNFDFYLRQLKKVADVK
jgi:thymidylate synthase